MNTVVSITDFRKNLFDLTDELLASKSGELIIKKDDVPVLRVTPYRSDAKERARRALVVAKKLSKIWRETSYDKEFFHGKKEKRYFKNLESLWKE